MADTPKVEPMSRLSPEELEKRYEELQRRSMLSAIYARHRNPDMYVRWVREDKRDIPFHKHLGFVFATDNPKTPEDKRQIDTVVQISDDGFYRTGDVILMQIDRLAYEYYCNRNVELSRAGMDAGKKAFRSEAEKRDIPVFERDKHGRIIS